MLFCFCTDEKDVEKIVYEVDQVLGGGELSLPVYPGVGNRPPRKKKNCKSPVGGRGRHGYSFQAHLIFVLVPVVTRPCFL